MTTNIFDGCANVLCSDSRWTFNVVDSTGHPYAAVYVDDTTFDKIVPQSDFSYIFAGWSILIDRWKEWVRPENRNTSPCPGVMEGFAICMVNTKSGAIEFEHGQVIAGSDHRFAGSGARPAFKCWAANKNASKAVSSAYSTDRCSGGQVKYFDMKNDEHNIDLSGAYSSINKLALTKGVVMYKSNETFVPIKDAIANDSIMAGFAKEIANGSASAEAPSGKDKIVWTEADVKRLNEALSRCYGLKG